MLDQYVVKAQMTFGSSVQNSVRGLIEKILIVKTSITITLTSSVTLGQRGSISLQLRKGNNLKSGYSMIAYLILNTDIKNIEEGEDRNQRVEGAGNQKGRLQKSQNLAKERYEKASREQRSSAREARTGQKWKSVETKRFKAKQSVNCMIRLSTVI